MPMTLGVVASGLVHALGAVALTTLWLPASATTPPRANVDSGSRSISVTLLASPPMVAPPLATEQTPSQPVPETPATPSAEPAPLPPAPASPSPSSPMQRAPNIVSPTMSWPMTDLFTLKKTQAPAKPIKTKDDHSPSPAPPAVKPTKLTRAAPTPEAQKPKLAPIARARPKKTAPPNARPAATPSRREDAGASTPARVVGDLSPRYPALSRRLGEEGLVVLRVQVLASGRAGEVRVLRQPGHRRLLDAAIAAVRAATFTPAMRHGEPVAAWLETPVRFVLK